MNKKSIFIKIFLFFLLIFSTNNIFSKLLVGKAAIIIDFETQETLFEVNADTLNFPASLTKMMTLYIVFDYLKNDKISWNTKMIVSKIAASRSCSCLDIKQGDKISVEDAVMALIIKSANNVATVISEHISGSERDFAKLVTQYARNIGMKKTTFKNASGLPNRAQMTTARDISILSYKIIKNFPNKYKLFKTEKFVWKGKVYKTHNRLMKSYEGADGIKTGYISASGFQLAFSAVRNNKRLIGVYFGGDTGKQRNQRLSFLMNKAFEKSNIVTTKKITKNKELKIKNKELKVKNKEYEIVVGTFKYKKNAKKHLKLIKSKYPKTTKNKIAEIILVESKGGQLYESRFQFFSKKNAIAACNRLKKYKRDCFIRS